ncbi:transcriptional regulator GlxA family with amidase domain [Actinocorallia herbida]|uniref:Transcriptional regulator GlxA family with amidase domain n=1 Tax=Actinocorallia herbida TaxID=58109 RepID=A0A3N1CZA0_9ACTN|nr:helix-turn-helix domain-containing protein [Actinocorallia herbida]ROO86556.1 transcriptional regulator GlxA family with amidase domain [Actinocorallia herbida]
MDGRRIVVVGYHAAELLDIACVTSAFAAANVRARRPHYDTVLATPGGAPITCGSGLTLRGQCALERVTGPLDTLIVSGGLGHEEAAADARLVGDVRRLARESRRVASVCTGATVLAATGLLDGRRATTHWSFAERLASRHPAVTVDPDPIFIRDGAVSTAAGVMSALDLTLAFIAEDHGPAFARDIARHLVTYLQRPGNQAQMSIHTAPAPVGDGVVDGVVEHIVAHLHEDLTAASLAALAGVSERHLTRLFRRHTGLTPGRYVRRARTEAAAHLLSGTALPLPSIAVRCGFKTPETLRQAFTDRYGLSPSRYRHTQSPPED